MSFNLASPLSLHLPACSYFVVWPLEAPLTADGQRFLVDPYGRGGLLLLQEVSRRRTAEEEGVAGGGGWRLEGQPGRVVIR